MKKFVVSIILGILTAVMLSLTAIAAEITLYTPSVSEAEIMPTRDFYIIGHIDREGKSASALPLNIKIELLNSEGEAVRTLKSNILSGGFTSAVNYLTDYEQGNSTEDYKGSLIVNFPPPDIIFDGNDRDSVRLAYTKIVVKEDYFAAIIYGGATKDLNLKYEDDNESALTDITEGEYTLVITALSLDGVEVCRHEQKLVFGNTLTRVISSDDNLLSDYESVEDFTFSDSFPGNWNPEKYFDSAPKGFSYTDTSRYFNNIIAEYSAAKKVSILLHDLNVSDSAANYKLGGAYSSESQKSYLYYDIGEKSVDFRFSGSELAKDGAIVNHSEDNFVEILRSETYNDDETYVDFKSNDGFVLTKGNTTTFYGVYSPFIDTAALLTNEYKISDKVSKIKVIITDNNNIIYEDFCNPTLMREGSDSPSRFEFSFSVTPSKELAEAQSPVLSVILCDADEEPIFISSDITLKINKSGKFIGGYDDSYWGKAFCDTINFLGQNPSEDALKPDEYITRGNFAVMINRLFGYSITTKDAFADLDEDSVYYNDCMTAQAVGYMTGDEHSRVNADGYLTREQAMIILARISNAEKGDKTITFLDSNEVSFWAKDYVDIMCSTGIVTGFDGYLHPTDSITVAEASALIIKTIKWMYNAGSDSASDSLSPEADNADTVLSDTNLSDNEFINEVNLDTLTAFVNGNINTLNSIAKYIQLNCPDGAYVGKVGNGLEIRDYLLGGFIKFSDDAVSLITDFSSKFPAFSIRYNPSSENAIHIMLGYEESGKQIGLTYTTLTEVKGKELTPISDNWYFYIQK